MLDFIYHMTLKLLKFFLGWENVKICHLLLNLTMEVIPFQKTLSGIPFECQTVWIQIRPDILSVLIYVQTVCKHYQPITLVGKELISHLLQVALYFTHICLTYFTYIYT